MAQEINELVDYSIRETSKLKFGELFLIKDLFKGYEWNRIPRSERLLLGTLFLNRIRSGCKGVKDIGKTSSGQQMYEKTGQ